MNKENKKVTKAQINNEEWTFEQKVDYYCNANNEITIATGNRKLGSQVCGLSMPYVITCREDAPCKTTGCYCSKGVQRFSNIYGTYCKNLRLYHELGDEFFDKITAYLKFSGYKFMRFLDSGDIVDYNFFLGLVKVCKDNPKVKFLIYTKKYDIVNSYLQANNEIPKNLKVYFSAWDKDWMIDNPFNLQIAYIDFDDKTKNPEIPTDAFCCQDGTGCCSTCYKCWHTTKDVVFRQH